MWVHRGPVCGGAAHPERPGTVVNASALSHALLHENVVGAFEHEGKGGSWRSPMTVGQRLEH